MQRSADLELDHGSGDLITQDQPQLPADHGWEDASGLRRTPGMRL
ncbi:hypothetical protein [Streptomyces osmaniensis]